MTEATPQVLDSLEERFPGDVQRDTRQGFSGYLVSASRLVEFARHVRDDLGYSYLTSLTGVDYLPESKMEVVYHACSMAGGPPLVFKVQVPRQDPVVPTLVSLYPGADFQEREAWDLLGIRFAGHPNLRRILMWEGFEGHPLRKDYHEPFF
ncbi:MAG: NADH-quinone oxidoreductase subunit C, partial [Anaerolineales bacterium]